MSIVSKLECKPRHKRKYKNKNLIYVLEELNYKAICVKKNNNKHEVSVFVWHGKILGTCLDNTNTLTLKMIYDQAAQSRETL